MPVHTPFFSIRKGCGDDSHSPGFHLVLWHSSENQQYSKIYIQENCVILELIWGKTKEMQQRRNPFPKSENIVKAAPGFMSLCNFIGAS